MAFILGLLSANNVFYLFVVGTTPILFICVYALLCLGYLFLTKPSMINSAVKSIPKLLWLFLGCTLLSIFLVVLFNRAYIYQWAVGIVDLLLYSAIVLLVIALKDNLSAIATGIAFGVIINALFVIYAFVLFKGGTIFTLQNLFPEWNMPIQLLYNDFRGWGLFLEPGHLMRYVATVSIFVYIATRKTNKGLSLAFLFSVVVIMIFTISSAIAVFVVGLIAFFLFVGKIDIKKTAPVFLISGIAFLVFFILSKTTTFGAEIWNYFIDGLFNITESDVSSNIRKTGMQNAIDVIKEYPVIGCGWNIFTKVFQDFGYYTIDVRGSYSALLSLIAELGIGALTYISFICSSTLHCLKSKSVSNIALGCSIMIYFALYSLTDYSINGDCAVFIGLIIANDIRTKSQSTIK